MVPLRLLLLCILFFALYWLLFGGKKKVKKKEKQDDKLLAKDILIEDPVCHTYVPKDQAVTLTYNNKSYYFCSEKCRDDFLADKGDN